MQQQLTLSDYMAMFRRRRWLMVSIIALISAASFLLAFSLPELYRSTAYISVNKPRVALDSGGQNIDTGLRIQIMSERVLALDNIEALVSGYNLYPELDTGDNSLRPQVLEFLNDVEIIPIEAELDPRARRPSEIVGFEVTYLYRDPDIVRNVVADLASLFLLEDQRGRTEVAAEATSFLEDESIKLEESLAEIEARIAKFKSNNAGRLPENAGLNMQGLERSERELEDAEGDLRSLRERRALLSTQLRQTPKRIVVYDEDGNPVQGADDRLQALQRELVSMSARYGPEHPDVVKIRREIEILTSGAAADSAVSLKRAIAEQEAALDDARTRYTPDHPDIRRLQRTLANLEDQLAAIEEAGDVAAAGGEPDNPEYIELSIQIDRATEEIEVLLRRRNELRRKITDYETRLSATPEVERQLASLSRNYDSTLRKYNEVRANLSRMMMRESAVEEQKSEHYELQRPASRPEKPAKPNRPVIILVGIFLAMTLGFSITMAAELIDGTVRNSRDVMQVMDMPPIAVIPQIRNKLDQRKRIRRRLLVSAGAVGSAAMIATLLFV